MTPTPQEAMRQKFEAFARDHHWSLERLLTGDGYLSHETAAGWYGWQAALRAQPEAAAQPAQPVAWRYKDTHGHWRYVGNSPRTEIEVLGAWKALNPEPIYAAPQPAQEGAECWLTKNSFGNCAKGHLPKLSELPAHEGVTGERAMLKALFAHWNEFGPEHGFGELIDRCEAGLTTLPPSPKTGEGSAIEGGDSTHGGEQ